MKSFLVLLVGATAQDVFLASQKKDADVIVVGAGWSGMSAAHHLVQAGVSVKVLEARSYTGGRSHSIPFGDPSIGVHTMEIGSGWLESSGFKGGNGGPNGKPPVSALAEEYGLKTVWVPGSTQNMSELQRVYASDGSDCDADGSLRRAANAAHDCIAKLATCKGRKCWTRKHDEATLREAMTKCNWNPQTECERVVDWGELTSIPGMVPEEQTLQGTLPDPVYDWWGPDDRYVVDERPRGYAGVIDYMVKDTLPDGDSRLIFNTKVTNVAYDNEGVTITTEGGETYTANAAITTFPLGVLKREHRSLFTPHVPDKLGQILDSDTFTMSNLTRVYAQFSEVFWDNGITSWLAADGHGQPGLFPEFHNLNYANKHPGSQTLMVFIANPESVTFENMDDEGVKAALMTKLRQTFPDKSVPEPSAFYVSRWGVDPLAYGCYSATRPGFQDKWYNQINAPLEDGKKNSRVFMAGEAMCDDLAGTTYGAYQSGRECALTYLHWNVDKKAYKLEDICWA